jgi:phage shock protein E
MKLRAAAALLGAVTLAVSLSACSSAASEPVTVGPDTVVLDVRTPEEFASGHLEGAELLDLSGGEFAAALPSLDPQAEYVVYCRSGNRSGQAVALMEEAGFESVTDLGSMEAASAATSIPIKK